MFSVFRATYLSDAGRITSGIRASDLPSANGLSELFNEFGGMSFQGGIYRILQPTELERWKERLTAAFPNRQNVIPFGYDWLGRLFALDPARLENGEPGVILLEPGTGEALEVPADLASFHEVELVEYHDAALASSFFDVWRQNNHPAPGYHEC